VGNLPLLKILSAVADRRYNGCMNPQEQRGHRPRLQRLKRLDLLFTSHPLYFVTACTENRQPMLANNRVNEDFRRFCETGLIRGVFVGKYVLMPDHLHLFVAFGGEHGAALIERKKTAVTDSRYSREPVAAVCDRRLSPLSEWMKSLKNALSKTLREMNIAAPHWQKGFFDHVMRSEESYSHKWLYVAENPVRKKLVERFEDWPYQGEIYPLAARGHV
jgi:putative transposase